MTRTLVILRAVTAVLLLAWICCHPSVAQTVNDLESVQQELQSSQKKAAELANQAASLGREVADLQMALISAAADVQRREREVTEIENTLATLGESERDKEAALKLGRKELAASLVALQRLSVLPRQALLFGPEAPVDMARSARLLGIVTPVLDRRARILQSELNEIKELRQEMAHRRDELTDALAELASENQRLADLVAKKSGLRQSTLTETKITRQRLGRLADQAKNLQDLIARLEQTEAAAPTGDEPPAEDTQLASTEPESPPKQVRLKKPTDLRAFPKDVTKLTAPVSGTMVTKFGARTETAGTMKGIEIETRPGAQIVATFDGQIAFEGPFRGYGQILIIEHSGGYHTILAGLDRVVVDVGQWLKAGEPIGRMGASAKLEAGQPENDTGNDTATGRPRLYVELRHDGQPFDPAPIFDTATATKGQ